MKMRRLLCVVISLILSLAFVVACAPGGSEGIKVTYEYNYEGAPAAAVETVEEGDVAPEPEDPVRDRYAFTGWYADADCSEEFDFEEALYEDVTVYAGWELTDYLVTFDLNYDGSETEVKNVAVGSAVTQPLDPQREGFLFTGWYTDAACTQKFDFSAVVAKDMTLYAGWEEVSGDTVTLTYMWNYDGAPDNGVCNVTTIKKGRKTTAYSAVRGADFYLKGWYTDAECTQAFDFNERVEESVTLYAKWYDIFLFEAEDTDLTGAIGSGYSGGGICVVKDTTNAGASGGAYVSGMYCRNSAVTFIINAEEAADEVVLVLSLSAEYFDFTLTDEMYTITVNADEEAGSAQGLAFDDITFTNVPSYTEGGCLPFRQYTISKAVSLKKGENVIKVTVTNDIRMNDSGTLNATAPILDALYLYTDVALTMAPKAN